jgi:hypothetical protein
VRTAVEADVTGRDLKQNGRSGLLRIERTGAGYTARVTFEGTSIASPGQSCAVRFGNGAAVPLVSQGRPAGMARYALDAPACPIAFDVLEGSVLVREPADACVFAQADCRIEARGLWGPEPSTLLPQAKAIEQARGAADKALRENYRALSSRARPQDVRPIIAEQAAFSAERETACRDYEREPVHGFCHARFTQARAATLAARLGADQGSAPARTAAPRRKPAEAPVQN